MDWALFYMDWDWAPWLGIDLLKSPLLLHSLTYFDVAVLGEPGIALLIFEEIRESASVQAVLIEHRQCFTKVHRLSADTYEKAMRSSCQGSTRFPIVQEISVLACG